MTTMAGQGYTYRPDESRRTAERTASDRSCHLIIKNMSTDVDKKIREDEKILLFAKLIVVFSVAYFVIKCVYFFFLRDIEIFEKYYKTIALTVLLIIFLLCIIAEFLLFKGLKND